jgi:hypothetical protein
MTDALERIWLDPRCQSDDDYHIDRCWHSERPDDCEECSVEPDEYILKAAHDRAIAGAEQRGRVAEREVWFHALDPDICKADYMGEVKMPITAHQWDDDGNEVETTYHVMVDWTAMKEIMAMISAKAAAIRSRGPA